MRNSGRGQRNRQIMSGRQTMVDRGGEPVRLDVFGLAERNQSYRASLWTGEHLQLSVMCIYSGEEVGLDRRPGSDQMIRIVNGRGLIKMGTSQYRPGVTEKLFVGDTLFIPAGVWYNIINIGTVPLKLYCISASPIMPYGTVQTEREGVAAGEMDPADGKL